MIPRKAGIGPASRRPQVDLALAGERTERSQVSNGGASILRDAWPNLALHVNLGGGSFKTKFSARTKKRRAVALVLGDDEAARGGAVKAVCARSWRRRNAPSPKSGGNAWGSGGGS